MSASEATWCPECSGSGEVRRQIRNDWMMPIPGYPDFSSRMVDCGPCEGTGRVVCWWCDEVRACRMADGRPSCRGCGETADANNFADAAMGMLAIGIIRGTIQPDEVRL